MTTTIQPDLWAPEAPPASPAPVSRPISRRVPSRVLAQTEPLSEPRDRAAFVLQILDEYVAAVGTSRPRRSEARHLRARAAVLRAELPPRWEEINQLEGEAADRDAIAAKHEERATRLRLTLTAHVVYPNILPVVTASRGTED